MDALLESLYKIHSHSGDEKKMHDFILSEVSKEEIYGELTIETQKNGNIYITKGNGDAAHGFYPCVCAHIDQVQTKPITHVFEVDGVVFGWSTKERTQIGLGADDKNGIWCALKLLEKCETIKLAFFISEEIGCVGSGAADMDFFSNVKFALQADRKGGGDIIFEACSAKIASDSFIDGIKKLYTNRKYKPTTGLSTDVWKLSSKGIGVSCCNISCGYYLPHTDSEYTVLEELDNCLGLMEEIINKITFRCPNKHTTTWKSTGGGYWSNGQWHASTSRWDSEKYDDDWKPGSWSSKSPSSPSSPAASNSTPAIPSTSSGSSSFTDAWFKQFEDLVYVILSRADMDTMDLAKFYNENSAKYPNLFARDYILAQHDAIMLSAADKESNVLSSNIATQADVKM